jgi:hypothetical protein
MPWLADYTTNTPGSSFSARTGPSFVWEAADADLVADMMVWAAQPPQAANEAFNITKRGRVRVAQCVAGSGQNPRS